ncbi:hypothetical protein ABZ208_37485 [Streptomyces sp. NPDC006208]|uniref:hypothetical protein n=1 Tax=Streptomyces sp. NPDC006208 TaxID=3156734 RepID=UPI0033B50A93
MKFKTKIQKVSSPDTRDGRTITVTRDVPVRMPALPRDWNAVALRVAIGVSLALTVAVIVWSTVKIGGLLHGGVGYVAAGIFDIGWLMALLLAYLGRYNEAKRQFADRLGWCMLAATMGALFWAGLEEGSVAMGVVGAAVSLFAKTIWIGVMKHVNAELSPEDRAWIAIETSEAQSKAAIAQVRRQTQRIEQSAVLHMLAMEKEQADVREAFGLPTTASGVEAVEPEPVALAIEPPTLAMLTKSDAIRYVKAQLPELEPTAIADFLIGEGVDVKPEYVAQILNKRTELEPEAQVIELRK